jgi:hypothetical protein
MSIKLYQGRLDLVSSVHFAIRTQAISRIASGSEPWLEGSKRVCTYHYDRIQRALSLASRDHPRHSDSRPID